MFATILRQGSGKLALVVAALVSVALSLLPLLGIPGSESALALGLVLPPFVAAYGAARVWRARTHGTTSFVFTTMMQTGAQGFLIAFVAYALLALNSLRVGSCDPLLGAAFFALGPISGCVLAAVVGCAWGYSSLPRRLSIAAAALTPIAAMLWSVERLWHTPAVFGYGYFFGYFPGALYDEDVAVNAPYLTLRVLTLVYIAALTLLCTALVDPHTQRIRLSRLQSYLPRVLLGAGCVAAVMYGETRRGELGLGSDVIVMREVLGVSERGTRCDLVVPRELSTEARRRLRDDCDFRVGQIERLLGVHQRARITAFFFRDAAEKRRLMGAGGTYIAKPWRNEVYLQVDEWPHPVLAHEIAHVVAGNLAPGPLHVPGRMHGLLPDNGMIEGVAVALAWDEREGLTPHEWTKALIALDRAPSLDEAMGTSFMLSPARNAYATAGSFYRFILTHYGAAVFRRAYANGDVLAATGKSLTELGNEWRTFLASVPLDEDALDLARARFARGAIFSRVCPHLVADLHAELAGDIAAGDIEDGLRTCQDALRVDHADTGVQAIHTSLLARAGRIDEAQRSLRVLEEVLHAPLSILANARESIADAHWRRGENERAIALYEELLNAPRTEDQKRVLEVKLLALRAGGAQSRAIYSLLVGESTRSVDRGLAVHLAQEVSRARSDGLGPYLEARQLINESHYREALPLLRMALEKGLPTQRLLTEATRLLAITAYATGDRSLSQSLWQSIATDAAQSEAARVGANDWLERFR